MSWSKRQDRTRPGREDPPAQLDRYELVDELGQGGMSVVFRARDKQLGRDVAVKLLHDFLARQEDARKRFHREAVAVARLRHPGIVEIYDYSGVDVEEAFIVCELIEGQTLRQFVDTYGAPAHPELGALVVQELVRALRHAHEQGIVHRDVKPENVMITARGQLKLMDFGIAQIMEGATKLTATGTLLGSPAHMAPEVIDGKPSDHRSDIFSVGTLLYWLCTGQLPFQAPNPSALFRLILEGTFEPPQMLNERIGNGLARIIERALDPDPEARYQDISQLQEDLQKELDEVRLEPADSLVKQFLSDPAGFAEAWSPKIVETLVERGQAALEAGQTGRAMDRFNRVLAVDPEHPEVRGMVSRIGRKAAFARRARRGAVFLSAATVAGLLVYNEAKLWPTDPATPTGAIAAVDPRPAAEARSEPSAAEGARAEAAAVDEADTAPSAAEAPASEPVAEAPRGRKEERPPPRTKVRAPGAQIRSAPEAKAMRRVESPRRSERASLPKRTPTPELVGAEPEAAAAEAGEPPSEPAASEADAASEAPALPLLLVKLGDSWGTITVDGKHVKEGAYTGEFELGPGRHTVEVSRYDGRFAPRVVELRDGQYFEVSGGREVPLRDGILNFRMPRDGRPVPGWIPNPKEASNLPPGRGT